MKKKVLKKRIIILKLETKKGVILIENAQMRANQGQPREEKQDK